MGYKRDLNGIKIRKQRNIKNNLPKNMPPVGWLLVVICCLVVATLVYMGTDKFSNPEYSQLSYDIIHNKHVKSLVISGDGESEKEETSLVLNTTNTTGLPELSGDGKLITDQSLNPNGLPMYDGYTSTDSSFDVDYSRFWTASGELEGLGDFTNDAAKNAVSREFSGNDLSSIRAAKYLREMPDVKVIGGYWTAENRLAVALPPGALIDPTVYEPDIERLWANPSRYTATLDGTNALVYVSGKFDNSLIGMHVDCVLDDGTVLALIIMDTKALHSGVTTRGEVCKDNLLQGYGHWRGNKNGSLSYKGILEVATSAEYKSSFDGNKKTDLHLQDHKIVGFRCYPATKGRY